MREIVIPEGNEEEFLKIGEKLGCKNMVFCYKVKDSKGLEEIENKIKALKGKTKIHLEIGLLAGKKDIFELKKLKKMTLVRSEREDDRWMIEKARPSMIYGFELEKSKDGMHQRNSGLNEVYCKIMRENEVIYGINYSALFGMSSNSSALVKGRMMQNIRLARKYKIKVKIASFATNPYHMRSEHDIESFFTAIGMHAKEAKDALM